MKEKVHIWQGKPISNNELKIKWEGLSSEISQTLHEALDTNDLLLACETLSQQLKENRYPELKEALQQDGFSNWDEVIQSLSGFLSRKALETKLKAELGTIEPFKIQRISYKEPLYEAWSPMGVLVHITAGNSPIVAPMAAVEGLLSGNINIIKVAGNAGAFPALFLELLGAHANIGKFIYMLAVSSKETQLLQQILNLADCVSVWGGEEAITSIRERTPQGIPVVVWGHKISFSYITPNAICDKTVDDLVHSICNEEQQLCSSPQCVMIDTTDVQDVYRFGKMLAKGLERSRELYPPQLPDAAQAAEITAVTHLYRTELCFERGEVLEAQDHLYRVLISEETKFLPSPLYRTIWVSPLPRHKMVDTLRSMRGYLQTAGLACNLNELNELTKLLYRSGVTRVTPVGAMSQSYTGEPHDGVFALPRFLKRVSFRTDMEMNGIVSFDEFNEYHPVSFTGKPIQGKKDYPPIPENGTRIVMKSGGTTGDPLYCAYTENDYQNYIVKSAAKGLLAAGLDVENDVTADLLRAGNLYGGMNSFISIFDELKAPHLNISGLDDYHLVAKYMIKGRATAVMSAPSYIVRLFKENEALFKSYGRISKIFYAGEQMSKGQREYLQSEFGINAIRSMIYGANETGTMGYACAYCDSDVFHLPSETQHLEILKMDSDEPVSGEEVGRLIFTGYKRENGRTLRYEIGDMGHWVEAPCPCGRKQPLFKLMGRYGDVIRMAGLFFNYQRICRILSDAIGYSGRLQLRINKEADHTMIFCMENVKLTENELIDILNHSDYDVFPMAISGKLLKIKLRILQPDEFIMNEISIKLRPIIYE